ncbi:hypothetical protein AG0111_0g9729 [Alternaria gaisen]|uniref:Uncharacterized protein n=1 Tax=Alternaria gaisen TaxID=167740 RepID=A0ACB6FBD0_9PLEO|nr:hypothetical protein AG0111_0g9729 [Alternaria gaisen]
MKVAVLLITTLVALASTTPVISLEPRQGIITDDPTKICNECKAKISTCTRQILFIILCPNGGTGTMCYNHCKCKAARENILCESVCGLNCP